ncbi:hypothetical protein [Serinicoccus sediminis]|uniref:hypothetical protein n=1 Tax=Serinicoccus sediminis TaxID=2306021 RepID=UPI00101F4761|nr:hypothetical protein [Serinicoccus sediminis]
MGEVPRKSWTQILAALDSHERPILFQWATQRSFALGEDVRAQLGAAIDREIPTDAFVAMDYTLDWLYAATVICQGADPLSTLQQWPVNQLLLRASIEDIDLLIAWEDRHQHRHTVLVEAKAFTGWTNKQMQGKIDRLAAIFGGDLASAFDVHFVMAGPKASKGLKTQHWPAWTGSEDRRHFLSIPDPGARYAVQRCTETGKPTSKGPTHWRILKRTWATGTQAPIKGIATTADDVT